MRILLTGTCWWHTCNGCGIGYWSENNPRLNDQTEAGLRHLPLCSGRAGYRSRIKVRVDVVELGDGRGNFDNTGPWPDPVVITASGGTCESFDAKYDW